MANTDVYINLYDRIIQGEEAEQAYQDRLSTIRYRVIHTSPDVGQQSDLLDAHVAHIVNLEQKARAVKLSLVSRTGDYKTRD
jgi:hypothetical protein